MLRPCIARGGSRRCGSGLIDNRLAVHNECRTIIVGNGKIWDYRGPGYLRVTDEHPDTGIHLVIRLDEVNQIVERKGTRSQPLS